MEAGHGAENAAAGDKVRALALSTFRFFYRVFSIQRNPWIRRMPGVAFLFRLVTERFLRSENLRGGLSKASVHGLTMYVRSEEVSGGFFLGEYEPTTSYLFKALIRNGDVVADVGAHWGYFTLLATTLCGPSGRVFAFEPDPENFAVLSTNLQANQITNVRPIPQAVSNVSGTATLHLSPISGRHSLNAHAAGWKMKSQGRGAIVVPTTTLEEFFAREVVCPRLVKLDVEGSEPLVVEGMTALLERSPELVLISEFAPQYLETCTAQEFLARLGRLGFEFSAIDEDNYQICLGWSIAEAVEWAYRTTERGQTSNLLLMRTRKPLSDLLSGRAHASGPVPKIVRARTDMAHSVHFSVQC